MDLTIPFACVCWFGSFILAGMTAYPMMAQRVSDYLDQRTAEAILQLSELFINASRRTIWMLYVFSPLVLGVMAWLLSGQWWIGLIGAGLGVVFPKLLLVFLKKERQKRFHNQLVDGLLLLSSSLKAGLSMLQAFTVLAEEMPAPIAQEFGLVLKETRMGVNLDEAISHLRLRMPSDDVTLFTTAVLVARETGGDITHVFGRLVETIRERRKLKERIKTLTFMPKMQGLIMAMLPVAFGYIVFKMSPDNIQFFVTEPVGKLMLVGVVALQLMSFSLFMRFSKSPL